MKITKKEIASRIGLARAIVKILDEKQARRIKLLQVEKQTSLTNYFVICEGRSTPHVTSLADEVDVKLSELGCAPLHSEGYDTANWIVLDFASVIVHIFDRNTREFYNLENLWRDGTEIDIKELLTPDGDMSSDTANFTEDEEIFEGSEE